MHVPSAWDGVVVIPSAKAFEPPKETETNAAATGDVSANDQEMPEGVANVSEDEDPSKLDMITSNQQIAQ